MKPIRRASPYRISDVSINRARQMYYFQKYAAGERNIPFLISFVDWLIVWEMSGKLDDRGRLKDQYVMARFGDKGPYAVGNVEIIHSGENVRKAHKDKIVSTYTRRKLAKQSGKRIKLKNWQISEIREVYRPGNRRDGHSATGALALAEKYGVSSETIRNIVFRRCAVYESK